VKLFKNHLKKIFVFFAFILAFSAYNIVIYAEDDYISEKSFDVIFVIDCSGSMNRNDTNRLAISAAKMFIDLLQNSNSRVGYACFADSAIPTRPLQKISENAESLKTGIGSAVYSGNTRV